MTLDPDGCTFWYTNEYYTVDGLNHQTRIGSFAFPACTPVGAGMLQGTVTTLGTPLAGVTVALGARTATTDANGLYVFTNLAAGTYPSVTASYPGYSSQTFASIAISEGATTVRDFSLSVAASAGCFTDTTQTDFQRGIATNCDLTGTPGSVTLINPERLDQQNTTVTNSGFGVNATNWAGQTFTPAVTGQVTRVDLDLFCSGCTGTTPNILVSIRATTGVMNPLPTGPDLAMGTMAGFSSASGGYFSALFTSPVTLTAGTRYAIVFRPMTNPSAGQYAYVCSCTTVNSNPYINGQRITSGSSGATGSWSADTTVGGRDLGFKVFVKTGFAPSGTFVSSVKDANPAIGATPTWAAISWTATVPAGTSLQFQAAASAAPEGPFTFVGADGTPATFFANGGSLAQFNGMRYVKYRAQLATTSTVATPTIADVTICFTDVAAVTTLDVHPASGIYGGPPIELSATLRTSGGVLLVGKTIAFTLNGASAGTAVTNGMGVATTPANVSIASIDAGT